MGVRAACPALEQLWASAEARREQARREGCTREGRLTPMGRRCMAASDEDCLASQVCTSEGRCTARDGACVATADVCRKSLLCRNSGRCTLQGDRCVVGEGDCAQSYLCVKYGECDRSAETGVCAPGSQQDCQRALACWGWGCRFDGRTCLGSQIAEPPRESSARDVENK
jgi:hypothetical protein